MALGIAGEEVLKIVVGVVEEDQWKIEEAAASEVIGGVEVVVVDVALIAVGMEYVSEGSGEVGAGDKGFGDGHLHRARALETSEL